MSGYLALKVLENQGNSGDQRLLNNNVTSENSSGGDDERPTPEQELLKAVKSNDISRLRHALTHASPAHLDHLYKPPDLCAVIHIAALNSAHDVVALLLKAGASVNIRDLRGKKFSALHYACQNGSPALIRVLLENGADANAKEGEHGRTPLHVLASKYHPSADGLDACLDELLKKPSIKVDRQDSSRATPLFLAAQKGWVYMAKALILKGARLDAKVGMKTTKDVVSAKCPGLLESLDLSAIKPLQKCYGDDLYDALKADDLGLFKSILTEVNTREAGSKTLILEEDHGEHTLLNYACDNGMQDFVEVLLKEGADPIKPDRPSLMTPVLYATRRGFSGVLQALLARLKSKGLLKEALRSADRLRETALHKVVKRECPPDAEGTDYAKCLTLLLEHKNYLLIDAQDEFDRTPLHYAVLCDDQTFVKHLLLSGAHLGIKSRFGVLAISRIQPSVLEEVLNDCVRHRKNINDRDFEIILHYSMLAPSSPDLTPETDCLKFLSRSRPHRHLLRHPIIDTFLFLKWQRIKHYYFINLFAYIAFLFALTTYIMLFFGSIRPSFLDDRAQTPQPPTNSTSLGLLQDNLPAKLGLQAIISVFWILGAVREGIQCYVSWWTYLSSPENWLEVMILTLTVLVLFAPLPYVSLQGMCAWLILASWVEFVLMLGRHPRFAVYVTMFTTVTFNFLKFILMFSSVIIAFSFSFFLVFQIDHNFSTYPKTLLKTIAMSTGEMEYTDLPLDDFPASSHLLFVVFVFLIVLVLMNLLNGLAVSDIALIQQEAEIVSYRSRVDLISYIESVFLAGPTQRPCPLEPCCFRNTPQGLNPVLHLLNYLGKRTLMFCNCLKDHQITMYPNESQNRWHVCQCHKFHIDEAQIEAAKTLVLAEDGKVSSRLSGLESRVESVMDAVKALTELVQRGGGAGTPSE